MATAIDFLRRIRKQRDNEYFRRSLIKRDEWMIDKFSLDPLSEKEIKEIERIWPFAKVSNKDLIWNRMYKKFYGFNPFFVNDYQLSFIMKSLNPYLYVRPLQNKAMLDVYYSDIKFPIAYIKCVNGVLYTQNGEMINEDVALRILERTEESDFFLKPTIENGCGKGVKKVNLNNVLEQMRKAGDNFIVQEKISQCEFLNNLNSTSLNCCRVTSVYVNGKFTLSSILKVGKKGAIMDNWYCSYLIGMNNNGEIADTGFDSKLNAVHETDNKVSLKGLVYPNFDKITSAIEKYHKKYFIYCGIVGWDVFIDTNNDVRVIEVNLDYPGVVGEQFCSGPFFQPLHDDIVNVVTK